jgi:zinc transport system substrate-binding protein
LKEEFMKRKVVFIIDILILILISFLLIFFCSSDISNTDSDKIKVVATIFPDYDFVRQIGGDKVEVKLLLNSGVESHTYEPSPKDMIQIENSDMFVYTGNEFEPWAENILSSVNSNLEIVDTSKNIELIDKEEFEKYYANSEILNEEHEEHHENESSYDSHIWLNPQNAISMIDDILASLCKIDPENEDYYISNAENYKNQIQELDMKFENLIQNSVRKEVAFAGEFSYSYFIKRYDLKFATVYNNCGEGEDPSIAKVKSVIDYINKHNLPVVFYEELSEGTVAKIIGEETETSSMVFYTIHNADIENDSYVKLMNKNYENLKVALN